MTQPNADQIEPNADQIEVSLFGPGYGECVLVHVGSGKWIIVDSCLDTTSRLPAALQYLKRIGADTKSAVVLVLVSHWHDDHVRGLSQILTECNEAQVAVSTAMSSVEFIQMVQARSSMRRTNVSSGVNELQSVFNHLEEAKRPATRAIADRRILTIPSQALAHGFECAVTSLSPSDQQVQIAFQDIAELMPDPNRSESRIIPRGPNHLAVACWISVGTVSILLGADLEETANPHTGWTAIVGSSNRPQGQAQVFKVPHHGSANGHNQNVWTTMLARNPFAILSPYMRGSLTLPRSTDVERIVGLTTNAYSSATFRKQRIDPNKYPQAVERTIREAGLTLTAAEPRTGQIRLRNQGMADFERWEVELFGTAYDLHAPSH